MLRCSKLAGRSLVLFAVACGDDDPDLSPRPGPADAGDSAVAADAALPTSDAEIGNGRACSPNSGMDRGSCSEERVAAYATCFEAACSATLDRCNGPRRRDGYFVGPCADYQVCIANCGCNDLACASACQLPESCAACLTELASCSSQCVEGFACLLGDAGTASPDASAPDSDAAPNDAGPDTRTCADLQACCASLADSERDSCNISYGVVTAGGATDADCARTIDGFCPR